MGEQAQKEDFKYVVTNLLVLGLLVLLLNVLKFKQVYSEEIGAWGSVCNFGWTIENAALVCRQMGLILNPADWRVNVPIADPSEPVLLT